MADHPELSTSKDAVVLAVHVQPGAGSTAVVGRHGPALKVRVAAPPTGGRANDAVVALVADAFGLAKGDVEVVSGRTGRQKKLRLGDLDLDAAARHVDRLLAEVARHPAS
ncbi:MAG TPA: DUF167 domain-containing protein [Acidimicrobiales bacterium]|nr:DUF167 domain-containing protein [Acidimicrobiales bacterium]